MNDLDRAIAAAREAHYDATFEPGCNAPEVFQLERCRDELGKVLAAIDAARSQAVAWQKPHIISFKNVERTNCPPELREEIEGEVSWELSLFGDSHPVTDKHGVTHYPTPLYAAPPAAPESSS